MTIMRPLIILISNIILFSNAYSFSLNNTIAASFEEDEVVINIASHSCDIITQGPEEILSMVAEATNNFWNTVPSSRLKLRAGAVVSVSSAFKTDSLCSSNVDSCTVNTELLVTNQILISCNNDTSNNENFNGETSVLALGLPNNIQADNIIGAVILLNDIAGSGVTGLSREEFIAVLSHEIGHAIGLGHSPVEDSLMYFQNHPNRKLLGLDDIEGLTYLYPREQPIACGSISIIGDQTKGTYILGLLFLIGLVMGLSKLYLYKGADLPLKLRV